MSAAPRFCPECREEFVASAQICNDCAVPLVGAEDLEEEEILELPPVEELIPIRVANVAWMRGFSEALAEAGISHRVDLPPGEDGEDPRAQRKSHETGVAVYVRPEDRERSLEVDAAYMLQQIPDADADAQVRMVESEDDRCPACGDPLGSAEECPGCGLFVGAGDA